MAVKIADTLKTLSNTFPVAESIDIDVNINGTTKRLQKAIDDGEIGGGSDSTWKGTHEEWEALSTEEKGKYEIVYFTDDYDESGIGESYSIWKGTRGEWEALSTAEKQKYLIVYFTDDYDGADVSKTNIAPADVSKTNIAPADETKFIDFAGRCHYCVKNEVCYVSFWNVKINSAVGTISSGVILPKPKSGFFGGTCLVGDHDSIPHAYAFILPNTGELSFNVKDTNTALYGAFSYPIAEE